MIGVVSSSRSASRPSMQPLTFTRSHNLISPARTIHLEPNATLEHKYPGTKVRIRDQAFPISIKVLRGSTCLAFLSFISFNSIISLQPRLFLPHSFLSTLSTIFLHDVQLQSRSPHNNFHAGTDLHSSCYCLCYL